MPHQTSLKQIPSKRPNFDSKFAILSAPVRHVMMMGTVWHYTKAGKKPELQLLEIGSWYGASALSWAQGVMLHNAGQGTLTCLDAWQPFLDRELHKDDVYVAMENALKSDEAYNMFLHNIATVPDSIQCQHLRGKSQHVLPLLGNEAFDIIFIDADHSYESVKQDIQLSMPLIKDGGIICGDDLNLLYTQCDASFAEANKHLDFVQDPKTGRNLHPGVTVAVQEIFGGDVSMWGGFWAMQKQGSSWKQFSLKDMPIHFPDHFPEEAIARAKSHLADISPLA